eukprot:8494063-Pyramimonas_sp.AAC.2
MHPAGVVDGELEDARGPLQERDVLRPPRHGQDAGGAADGQVQRAGLCHHDGGRRRPTRGRRSHPPARALRLGGELQAGALLLLRDPPMCCNMICHVPVYLGEWDPRLWGIAVAEVHDPVYFTASVSK